MIIPVVHLSTKQSKIVPSDTFHVRLFHFQSIHSKSVGQQDNLTEAILENNEGGRNARRASSSKVHDLT
jgi:hypothetical protein